MAVLFSKMVFTDGYEKLSDITGIEFTAGKTYLIQTQNPSKFYETETKPTAGGFYISSNTPFNYTASSTPMWIKTYSAYITIAE